MVFLMLELFRFIILELICKLLLFILLVSLQLLEVLFHFQQLLFLLSSLLLTAVLYLLYILLLFSNLSFFFLILLFHLTEFLFSLLKLLLKKSGFVFLNANFFTLVYSLRKFLRKFIFELILFETIFKCFSSFKLKKHQILLYLNLVIRITIFILIDFNHLV